MKIWITAVFFLGVNTLNGQLNLTGKIENLPPSIKQVALDYWSGESWTEMDRIEIGTGGSFSKRVKTKFGQARLRLWGEPSHWIDFLLPGGNGGDSVLDFGTVDYRYFDGNPAKLEGKENEAYYFLLTDHKKYRLLRDSLARADSLSPDKKLALEKQAEQAKVLSNKQCRTFSAALKGSFTGDVVANLLYVPVKTDYVTEERIQALSRSDFEREYLLDRLPLHDSRVLHHNGLIRALNFYTSRFLEADSSAYARRVLGKRKGNAAVDSWLFKYLFQVSVNYKNDAAVSYLVEWYDGRKASEKPGLDRATLGLMSTFKNCEVGKKAYDLTLPDITGKQVRLADVAAKNKLTLLLFWRTDCGHCHEFESELGALYKKFASKGLEVIGICIDEQEASWKKYLAANPALWPNLYPVNRELYLKTVTNFPIPGTPAVIAVSGDFTVKNRMITRFDIEKYLESELGR